MYSSGTRPASCMHVSPDHVGGKEPEASRGAADMRDYEECSLKGWQPSKQVIGRDFYSFFTLNPAISLGVGYANWHVNEVTGRHRQCDF